MNTFCQQNGNFKSNRKSNFIGNIIKYTENAYAHERRAQEKLIWLEHYQVGLPIGKHIQYTND